jgi:rhodanese-related sulfurtransferase
MQGIFSYSRGSEVRAISVWSTLTLCAEEHSVRSITADRLRGRLTGDTAPFMLDVREPEELADGVIAGSVNIPMDEVENRLDEIPVDREIVVICHMGMRSAYIAKRLLALGYHRVTNLRGGINAWLSTSRRSMTPGSG